MKKFEHDYISYKDGEIDRIGCMSCNATVAAMEETPSQRFPGKIVLRLRRYSNYRTRRVDMSDGSYTDLIMCVDCRDVDPKNYAQAISKQIVGGWEAMHIANGRDERAMKELKASTQDLTVLGKEK